MEDEWQAGTCGTGMLLPHVGQMAQRFTIDECCCCTHGKCRTVRRRTTQQIRGRYKSQKKEICGQVFLCCGGEKGKQGSLIAAGVTRCRQKAAVVCRTFGALRG